MIGISFLNFNSDVKQTYHTYFAFVLLNNRLELHQLNDKIERIVTIKTLNTSFWGLKELLDYENVQQVLQHEIFL